MENPENVPVVEVVEQQNGHGHLQIPETHTNVAPGTLVTPGWRCEVSTLQPVDEKRPATANTNTDTDVESVWTKHDVSPKPSFTSLSESIATQPELERYEQQYPLPPKRNNGVARRLRWDFLSMYRKAFTIVFVSNMIALILFLTQLGKQSNIASYHNAATAASANFCIGILFRNEHVVNLLFRVACSLPVWTPLALRRYVAKVYSYGGVHSGCGISGAIWYIVFSALVMSQFTFTKTSEAALGITTGLTLLLLVLITSFAHPYVRMRMHDHFEATHRFGGWTAIACLWAQTMFLISTSAKADQSSFGMVMIRTPSFWFLVTITLCLIYPWTRLRSRKVRVERLSQHATRLHFDYTDLETCVGIRVTDAPLKETHAFATIPNYKGSPGFSILISNAGDWTNKIITNSPERLWVKGAPTIGVMRVAMMFRKVLVVATGSGIGPCLSFLQANPDYPMRVVWSAQKPQVTYGDNIMAAVYRADPDAMIVDTKRTGRGNLLALAYGLYKESGCEAAVVISNPVVTRTVVYGFESRGLPAFGAIFDS